MIVERNQIFNLMDTNGRRSDVLNALKIYLEILEELKQSDPLAKWETYPASLSQVLFYEKALEKSKDVFRVHSRYDQFLNALGNDYQAFIQRDKGWIQDNFAKYSKVLDEAIEKRSRHYTSNLVKIGFVDAGRNMTEAGYSYLRGNIVRDRLEEILPLDNVNLVLLRQLAKLKIFGASNGGKRPYYAPFMMALVLLLEEETVDRHTFETIVQGLTPYSSTAIKEAVGNHSAGAVQLEEAVRDIAVLLPAELVGKSDLPYDSFKTVFKGSKSNDSITKVYYEFFCALKNFRENRSEGTYSALLECLDRESSSLLNKAFGYGKAVFSVGSRGSRYSLKKFLEKNEHHPLLTADDYLSAFYTAYFKSKWVDGIREYSDTTIRLLGATGLFQFKNLPELSYKAVLSLIFDVEKLRKGVFGEMTDEEYFRYEVAEDCLFGKNSPLSSILHYSSGDVAVIMEKIEDFLGVGAEKEAKKLLNDQKNRDFIAHIDKKYPKEKIMELLPLFSDRKKDYAIKKAVHDAATVPTIYEYIVGIAWYYISNREFDLYNSLNLTLNADFEPVIHASGGDGDIVIHYDEMIVMLEVTMMNKQAQKRGEWEPVLRHSLNLKAANAPKETVTFFVADELDHNTVNIWRAVAAATLESTNTHTRVDGVVIMPFTNGELLKFLEKGVYYKEIVEATKASFSKVPKITDVQWHEDILSVLMD